jgi:hypothetical protein
MNDPTKKDREAEPELPDKTRREDEEADVERQQPIRPDDIRPDDRDIEEVPARRGGADSGDIERGREGPPPAREGHDREMQERRPHRDQPI